MNPNRILTIGVGAGTQEVLLREANRYAQRGCAIPVCGTETLLRLQMWDAGNTPAWSTP